VSGKEEIKVLQLISHTPPTPAVPLLSRHGGERALYEYEFWGLISGKSPLPVFI